MDSLFCDWLDAANTAMSRLYEAVSEDVHPDRIRLYGILSISSSLCAIAIALKEGKNECIESSRNP